MNRHLLLSLCAMLSLPVAVSAQDVQTAKMVITGSTSGTVQVTSATEITFNNGEITFTTGDDTQSFTVADIDNIVFDLTMSAAENVEADLTENLSVALASGILTVTAADNAPINVAVYGANGSCAGTYASSGEISVDLNPLQKGLYVIKVNSKAIKFIR